MRRASWPIEGRTAEGQLTDAWRARILGGRRLDSQSVLVSVGAVRRTAHGHRGSGLNGKIIVFVVGLGPDHVLPP